MYVLGVFVCFKANVNVMTRGRERRGPLQTGGEQLNKKKSDGSQGIHNSSVAVYFIFYNK